MKKRTNRIDRITEYIFVSIIPFVLTITLLLGGPANTVEKLMKVGLFISYPEELLSDSEKEYNNISEKKALSNSEITDYALSSALYSVPEDIAELIKQAEQKYSTSVPAGNIIEKDYSKQNATAEYDGIYVRNTTLSHDMNISEYLNRQVYANVNIEKPAVLVYHTHTSESYELLDRGFYSDDRASRSEKSSENMIRVGEAVCKVLEANGFKTIHDKTVYDDEYSGAYERSCDSISKILKDNPSIQIVLDIHRDAIYQKDGSKIKTVKEINGRKAAQIMLISGCEDGNVTDFPNWQKNLAFAIQLQRKIKDDSEGLARPLMFCSRKYNMHLMPCAISVEIGTDANTLAEAVYGAELFAKSLCGFLEEYTNNE